jgi:hypothetical protein
MRSIPLKFRNHSQVRRIPRGIASRGAETLLGVANRLVGVVREKHTAAQNEHARDLGIEI